MLKAAKHPMHAAAMWTYTFPINPVMCYSPHTTAICQHTVDNSLICKKENCCATFITALNKCFPHNLDSGFSVLQQITHKKVSVNSTVLHIQRQSAKPLTLILMH